MEIISTFSMLLTTSIEHANELISEEIKRENAEMDIITISAASMHGVVDQLM